MLHRLLITVFVFESISLLGQSTSPVPPSKADPSAPMYVCSDSHPPEKGPCASPPRLISHPDPIYPEEARRAAYGDAKVVLWLVVTEEGRPKYIRVQKAAGHGFDEAAIEAVKQWTFEPAMYEGRPVSVMVNVEANFKLVHGPQH